MQEEIEIQEMLPKFQDFEATSYYFPFFLDSTLKCQKMEITGCNSYARKMHLAKTNAITNARQMVPSKANAAGRSGQSLVYRHMGRKCFFVFGATFSTCVTKFGPQQLPPPTGTGRHRRDISVVLDGWWVRGAASARRQGPRAARAHAQPHCTRRQVGVRGGSRQMRAAASKSSPANFPYGMARSRPLTLPSSACHPGWRGAA